jgi:DNA-binding NtrC family response regulator
MSLPGAAPTLLIVDDQLDVLESLRLLLKPEGYKIETANSPMAAVALVAARELDVALIDLNYSRDTTSGDEGLALMTRLQTIDATLPVVVMTAWGTVDVAVEAMRRGARDFVQKPWDNERLLAIVRNQVALVRALRHGQRLEEENRALRGEGFRRELIATSPAMRPVLELLALVGPSDANVLITGEHGTGKELVARALVAASPRAERPLVTVNLGGLAEGVFSSELFGHVKGAFTDAKVDRVGRFEMADGGTLFLDEIGNLPLAQQATLLRVLETGEVERVGSSRTRRVNVRVLSATNADLRALSRGGAFREDLLFRINTVQIHLPPLRDRGEDIMLLANHFLGRFNQRYNKKIIGFERAAAALLGRHPWPGNVRELAHVIERAVLLSSGDEIRAGSLGLSSGGIGDDSGVDEMSLEEVEKVLIAKALKRFDGNVSRAADALGLSRASLYRRMEKYKL